VETTPAKSTKYILYDEDEKAKQKPTKKSAQTKRVSKNWLAERKKYP
jgi:hypothetical protein